MDVSVVINTYNCGPSLRGTLLALRRQTYRRFEVVVVNGPATDDTAQILTEFAADVRVGTCLEVHLSKSRNIGIALAAGEVIAFIDADALPDTRWLEELVAGYDSARVAGVGGLVYEPTGTVAPSPNTAAVCDRRGNTYDNLQPPFWGYSLTRPDRFLRLSSTNASFRRHCLAEIGGFDEEIDSSFEQADVCLRLVDRGYHLRLVASAAVYQQAQPGPTCPPGRVIKNRTYFALRARPNDVPAETLVEDCDAFLAQLGTPTDRQGTGEPVAAATVRSFAEDADIGRWLGIARGLHGPRKLAAIPPRHPEQFAAFPTRTAGPDTLTLCVVAPENGEGADYAWSLARGFAECGHEVHWLTHSSDHNRLDFDDGLWIHCLAPETPGHWDMPEVPPTLKVKLAHAAAVHREVRRLRQTRFLDLVSIPAGSCAGLYCLLDDDLTCVLAVPSQPATAAEAAPPLPAAELQALQQLMRQSARHVHAVGEKFMIGPEAGRALHAYADLVNRRQAA